jgi:hypothetical protein
VQAGQGSGGLGVGHERWLPAQQLVQDDAEGVDVGAAVDRRPLDLFGGQVLGGAERGVGARQVEPVGGLGDAEVGDEHAPVDGEQHVGRLDVAVHDAGGVGLGEGVGHLGDDGRGVDGRQLPAPVELRPQRVAADQLHDDGLVAVVGDGVVDGDDRRVGQAGGGQGLAAEARDERVVGREVRVQQLDGHRPGQHLVGRLPDGGHAPGRDALAEAVAPAEQPARFQGGGGGVHSGPQPTRGACCPLRASL